ncbi:hypothetical protein G6F68_017783 [Rhizopus microsporus]|nr:hypothetical protein G6F68_017783 [Rhizopus microsporus]
MAETDRLQQGRCPAGRLGHGGTGQQYRHHHVFQRGEFRQQVMELIDKAQRLVAQQAARGIRQRRHALAGHIDFAGGWNIQPTQQVQQRALAGAGRTDDRHRLASGHVLRRGSLHRRG